MILWSSSSCSQWSKDQNCWTKTGILRSLFYQSRVPSTQKRTSSSLWRKKWKRRNLTTTRSITPIWRPKSFSTHANTPHLFPRRMTRSQHFLRICKAKPTFTGRPWALIRSTSIARAMRYLKNPSINLNLWTLISPLTEKAKTSESFRPSWKA